MDIKVDYRALTKMAEGFGNLNKETLDNLEVLVKYWAAQIMVPLAKGLVPKRTGRLAQGIAARSSRGDSSVYGTVRVKDVAYAHIVEHGFQGLEQVAQYSRTVKSVYGRQITAAQTVRAHDRQVNTAAESFLQPVLEQAWPAFQEAALACVLKTAQDHFEQVQS